MSSTIANFKRERGISLDTLQWEEASSHDDGGTSSRQRRGIDSPVAIRRGEGAQMKWGRNPRCSPRGNPACRGTFGLSQLFHSPLSLFIKRLLSSSSLSAIRVVSSAYLRLLIFLPAILIPAMSDSVRPHRHQPTRLPCPLTGWGLELHACRYACR